MPRKCGIAFLCLFLAMFIATSAQALLIGPYSQGLQDPVSFLVVDEPDSTDPGQVVLSTSSFWLPIGYRLEYLYAGFSKRHTDGDGYGSICDSDFNGDGTVNFADLAQLKSVFFSTSRTNEDQTGQTRI